MRNPYNVHQQRNHPSFLCVCELCTREKTAWCASARRKKIGRHCRHFRLSWHAHVHRTRALSHHCGRQSLSVLFRGLFSFWISFFKSHVICSVLAWKPAKIQRWLKNRRCWVIALRRWVPDRSPLKEDETSYTRLCPWGGKRKERSWE